MDRTNQLTADRLLWDSSNGTAIRVGDHYELKPPVEVKKHRPTEAEYNAQGRAHRRRQNRRLRSSGKPHAAR